MSASIRFFYRLNVQIGFEHSTFSLNFQAQPTKIFPPIRSSFILSVCVKAYRSFPKLALFCDGFYGASG
jgi:hypothetical protein